MVVEPHEAVERIAVEVENEVAAASVRDVLCPVADAHEPIDNLPATGELERDVDLGAGCRRLAPPLGMGRGGDAAEIWR